MNEENILKALQAARESKKRNFKQSIDLMLSFKGLDMKKAEHKIKAEVMLPHLPRMEKIGLMVDNLIPKAQKLENVRVIRKEEIEGLARDKKSAKKLANECAGFIAEAPLMPLIGKSLGPVLSPRNMMPAPVPANLEDLKGAVEKRMKIVRVQIRDSPTIQLRIGTEEMDDKKVAENARAAIDAVIAALPKNEENMKKIVIKTTMGKPVKVEMK